MKFGFIHRTMTNALAALGVLALVASGELSRWITIAILTGLLGALLIPDQWHDRSWLKRIATIGPVLLLVVQISRLFLGHSLLELAVEFAAALQIVRLATRRGAAHDQQVIVLTFMHFIAGTVLGGGLGYALCFLGFLIIVPATLILSHLRREVEGNYRQGARDRTGLPVDVPRILRSRRVVDRTFLGITCLLAIPILGFTSLVFVVFPRVGLSLLLLNRTHTSRLIGFSDRVDLGGVGTLRDDPTIVLRVEIPDLPEPPPERVTMYLRGTAFDSYDGRAWERTNAERKSVIHDGATVVVDKYPDSARDRRMRIDLEPIEPTVLFIPSNTTGFVIRSRNDSSLAGSAGAASFRIERGSEGEFRYRNAEDRGIRYDVFIARQPMTPTVPLMLEERTRYLTIPANLPTRVLKLGETWAQEKSSAFEKARTIEEKLRNGFRYDLSSSSSAASSPLDHFLFESKRGHCEFYSTAMSILLRSVGIPSRNVTGFVGGTYNRFGHYYAVRQGDAHSWVEAYLDGTGWVTFDPTPPSEAVSKSEIHGLLALLRDVVEASGQRWDRHVVGYDLYQQVSLFDRIRHWGKGAAVSSFRSSPQRQPLLFLVIFFIVGAGIAFRFYWRRRKNSPNTGKRSMVPATPVSSLYEALDVAMVAQGIGRPQGTPPLRHARGLLEQKHAQAEEIFQLTLTYLDIRFGNETLDEPGRKRFEQRVRAIRLAKTMWRNDPIDHGIGCLL